jgi:hypothetical protein
LPGLDYERFYPLVIVVLCSWTSKGKYFHE